MCLIGRASQRIFNTRLVRDHQELNHPLHPLQQSLLHNNNNHKPYLKLHPPLLPQSLPPMPLSTSLKPPLKLLVVAVDLLLLVNRLPLQQVLLPVVHQQTF